MRFAAAGSGDHQGAVCEQLAAKGMGNFCRLVAVQVLSRPVAPHQSAHSFTCIEELALATGRNHAVALVSKLGFLPWIKIPRWRLALPELPLPLCLILGPCVTVLYGSERDCTVLKMRFWLCL